MAVGGWARSISFRRALGLAFAAPGLTTKRLRCVLTMEIFISFLFTI